MACHMVATAPILPMQAERKKRERGMSMHLRLSKQTLKDTDRKCAIFAVITFSVSLVQIFKAPDFWVMLIPECGRFLQLFEVNTHLQAASILRYQMELAQNLATQIISKSEPTSLEIGRRHIPFDVMIKNLLMIATCDISVIIPALNEERYLARCLGALVRQCNKGQDEIVVVDGGSTDRTVEIAEEYADKVLIEPARPVGAARNLGARQAKGEFLAFIDADTVACDEWVREIACTLDSNPRAVGVPPDTSV